MQQCNFQSNFFKPQRLLWKLLELGPAAATSSSPDSSSSLKSKIAESKNLDSSKGIVTQEAVTEETPEQQREKLKAELDAQLKAQLEAEKQAYQRVDELFSAKKEEINTFITSKSQENVQYKAGDWKQWNKEFLEAIGNPDPNDINIALIQWVIFRRLKLGKDPQAQELGKFGPYTLVAMATYMGQELPAFVYKKEVQQPLSPLDPSQEDYLGQSTLDPHMFINGEPQSALNTVTQQYQAEKDLAIQETTPKPEATNISYKIQSASVEFDKNETEITAAKINKQSEEAAVTIKAIKDDTEVVKVDWDAFAAPFVEMINEEPLDSRALNKAVKEYRQADREFKKATKDNYNFLKAGELKELAYQNLEKAKNSYYEMQASVNQQAAKDYRAGLEKITEPYFFPPEIKLEEFNSLEAFNDHALTKGLQDKAASIGLLDQYLNKEGILPLHLITSDVELEKYIKGADETEKKIVLQKLWKKLEDKGLKPIEAINNRIYLNNLKRFSKLHENLLADVIAQKQVAMAHIKSLSLDQLLGRDSANV